MVNSLLYSLELRFSADFVLMPISIKQGVQRDGSTPRGGRRHFVFLNKYSSDLVCFYDASAIHAISCWVWWIWWNDLRPGVSFQLAHL